MVQFIASVVLMYAVVYAAGVWMTRRRSALRSENE